MHFYCKNYLNKYRFTLRINAKEVRGLPLNLVPLTRESGPASERGERGGKGQGSEHKKNNIFKESRDVESSL